MAQRLSAAPAIMFYNKKLFPSLVVGLLGIVALRSSWSFDGIVVAGIQALIAMVMLLLFLPLFRDVWRLADEVLDEGDALVVRHGRSVRRVLKADVVDVYVHHRYVDLRVRTADGESRLVFMARARWPPFSVDPRIKDLAERAKGRLAY